MWDNGLDPTGATVSNSDQFRESILQLTFPTSKSQYTITSYGSCSNYTLYLI